MGPTSAYVPTIAIPVKVTYSDALSPPSVLDRALITRVYVLQWRWSLCGSLKITVTDPFWGETEHPQNKARVYIITNCFHAVNDG